MPGEQAQIDWKEDVKYTTKYGENCLNVFVWFYHTQDIKYFITLSRSQDVFFNFMYN